MQLTCCHQICIVGASDSGATGAGDLPTFRSHRGQSGQKHFGKTRVAQNVAGVRYTQRPVILYAQSY